MNEVSLNYSPSSTSYGFITYFAWYQSFREKELLLDAIYGRKDSLCVLRKALVTYVFVMFSALPGSGGDWEVMMLADELEKREREEARRLHYASTLRELEEVCVLNLVHYYSLCTFFS